jgi:two-component system LytT family response regulator
MFDRDGQCISGNASTTVTIRTLLVDDEPLARTNLRMLLGRDPEIEIAGECSSGVDAPGQIRAAKPDLLFLDVQMPECDGFEVLERLGMDVPPAVVFVTAYDQYALRAFEAGALDYLLKPFDSPRFELALERAKHAIRRDRELPRKRNRLAIKSGGQIWLVSLDEIDWIEAADYYAALHVGTRTHMLRRTLVELEQELDPNVFCRIHRSTIVNLERVRGLKMEADGESVLLLDGGTSLRMSRRYRRQVQMRLDMRGLNEA